MGIKLNSSSLEADVRMIYEKRFDTILSDAENIVRSCAKSKIVEDKGGLTGSISSKKETYNKGYVLINTPYAVFVNYGRGKIRPKNKRMLSNEKTSAQRGHKSFFAPYADSFKGYNFVKKAIEELAKKY